jgi:hypothetical protein
MCDCLKLNLGSFCHLMMNDWRLPYHTEDRPDALGYVANPVAEARTLRASGILQPAPRRRHRAKGGARLRGRFAVERQVAAHAGADGAVAPAH